MTLEPLNKIWRLNNLYKIRSKSQGVIQFKLNRLQIEIAEQVARQKPIRHITLKARQVGLSTFWILWHLDDALLHDGRAVAIISHKEESLQYLASIADIAIKHFPGHRVKLAEDNKRRLRFPDNNSEMIFSLEIRSTSLTNLHLSEWMLSEDAKVQATIGATSKTTHITGESTGNGIGNDGYLTYMDALEGKNDYLQKFIPWYDHQEYELPCEGLPYIKPDKRERKFGLSQPKIRFRRSMQSKLKQLFYVEYPETIEDAFMSSGISFFNAKKMVALANEARNLDQPVEEGDNYVIWEKPHKNHKYALGGDAATGDGTDYSCFKIRCLQCRAEAMAFRGKVRGDVFAQEIDKWARDFNVCLVGIERNFPGNEILYGLYNVHHYPNLYYEPAKDTRKKIKKEALLGWHTTNQTKPVMCAHLKEAVEGEEVEDENTFEPDYTVRDLTFLNETLTFQRDGVKLSAISGKNDDTIIAAAICNEMILAIKKKQHRGDLKGILIGGQREQTI